MPYLSIAILHKYHISVLCNFYVGYIADLNKKASMALWGCQRRFKRFLSWGVFLYAWSFYSVIQFLYSYNIHCFIGKGGHYTIKKLECAPLTMIMLCIYCIIIHMRMILIINQYVYIDIDYTNFLSIYCIDKNSDMIYLLQ